jgi:signal transduction histidine kinase
MAHALQSTDTDLRHQIDRLLSFNRNIAHDLREPVGSLASGAQLAQLALARGDVNAVRRLLDLIECGATGVIQLLSDLLALAQGHEEHVALTRVDLTMVAQGAIDQLLPRKGVGGPEVRLEALPTVLGAPSLLHQVFVNLVGNALKFSGQTACPVVEVGVTTLAGEQVIYVQDNGVGFAPTQASRLFQPFCRLHGHEFAGHGVGLSLVKRIVELHGGHIVAEPRASGGAVFYFTLGHVEPPLSGLKRA